VSVDVKLPVPEPSVVWEPEMVRLGEVPQQTPLAVTVAPPSLVTFPPLVAAVCVMPDVAVVVTDGKAAEVVNVCSFPYAVPTLLMA
jgi:hypothetical protein